MPARKVPPLKPRQFFWVDRGIFARGTRKPNQPDYGASYLIPAHIAQRFGIARRRREIAGSTLTAARNLQRHRRDQILMKDFSFLDPPPDHIPTVRQFAEKHVDRMKGVKKSWRFDEAMLKPFVARHGELSIDRVTSAMIKDHKAERAREPTKRTGMARAPRTINHEMQALGYMFRAALEDGLIRYSPMEKVKPIKVPDKPIRVLSEAEEKKLLANAPEHLRDLIVLVLHTGLRKSEALGLRRSHVDLEGRKLTIVGKGDKLRYVPLEATALAVVRRRMTGPLDYLFAWEIVPGTWQPLKHVTKTWVNTIRRAGIPHIKFHALRDTYATRAVHLGVDLVTLQSLLGHENIETTRRYAHPTPEENRRAARLMEERFGAGAPVAPAGPSVDGEKEEAPH